VELKLLIAGRCILKQAAGSNGFILGLAEFALPLLDQTGGAFAFASVAFGG
jgi:hypothetical protein